MDQDCWKALNCGREDECPAYPNNGRTCFAVTGTMCRGEKQGTFTEKVSQCREKCDFYKDLMREQCNELFSESA